MGFDSHTLRQSKLNLITVKAGFQNAGSIAVHEKFEGKTVWQGIVEVFEIKGHPKAKTAYAWSYKTDSGETRYVVVLELPPVNSAQDAVRAYIVSKTAKKSS